jgi:FkbM family methyltransferase
MTVASAFRFRNYLLRLEKGKGRREGVIAVRMKRPVRGDVALRETGSDLATFREIMLDEIYGQVVGNIRGFLTVIDLGANIGLASLYLAHHSPASRILSVEPNPQTYQMLVRNVQSLGGRCQTLKAAAWGTHNLLAPDPQLARDRFSTVTLREASSVVRDEWTVEGFTMPEILDYSGFDTVDLLKVDIEGAEAEIFSGSDLKWLRRVGAIAIEFHKDSREKCRFDDLMKSYEFEIWTEEHHTVLASKPKWGIREGGPQLKEKGAAHATPGWRICS